MRRKPIAAHDTHRSIPAGVRDAAFLRWSGSLLDSSLLRT
jgi:hypothetical protein